ncbi:alpha/beta fold hydrolase [Ekhidna sp.]|uniref:alpha/beta fold hydrolase n=1 Tax=Ekhidna sp. TaxID=2608089 RepID=UPI003CCBE1FD
MLKIDQIGNSQVSYYDNLNQRDPTLLFIHGNSSSHQVFKYQIDDELLSKTFRIIAIDLPGHYNSKPFKNPLDYCLEGYTKVISDLFDKLGLKESNTTLVGHSLGGHIAIEILPLLKNLNGIVIFQAPPINSLDTIGKAFPDILDGIPYQSVVSSSELESYVNCLTIKDQTLFKQWFKETDSNARLYLGQSVARQQFGDEIAIWNSFRGKKAIFHGSDDKLVNLDYLKSLKLNGLWRDDIVKIPHSTHSPCYESPEVFNELLISFLIP